MVSNKNEVVDYWKMNLMSNKDQLKSFIFVKSSCLSFIHCVFTQKTKMAATPVVHGISVSWSMVGICLYVSHARGLTLELCQNGGLSTSIMV